MKIAALLIIITSTQALALYNGSGEKSPGDGGAPTMPCFVEGKFINTLPVNVCINNYKGSPSKKTSYKKNNQKKTK